MRVLYPRPPPIASASHIEQTNQECDSATLSLIEHLRSQNSKLVSDNESLRSQVNGLVAQVSKLTEKIDQLRLQVPTQSHANEAEITVTPGHISPAADVATSPQTRHENHSTHPLPLPQVTNDSHDNEDQANMTTVATNPQPKSNQRLSWATITSRGIEALPDQMKSKFQSSIQSLQNAGFASRIQPRSSTPANPTSRSSPQPKPVPVYFSHIPRGPIGKLRRALMEFLPTCLLYTSPSPRDQRGSRMPSSA